MKQKNKTKIDQIIEFLTESKVINLESYKVGEFLYYIEDAIVCSALNEKHLVSLTGKFRKFLKDRQITCLNVDFSTDWVLFDCDDIFIHIFDSKLRDEIEIDKIYQHDRSST